MTIQSGIWPCNDNQQENITIMTTITEHVIISLYDQLSVNCVLYICYLEIVGWYYMIIWYIYMLSRDSGVILYDYMSVNCVLYICYLEIVGWYYMIICQLIVCVIYMLSRDSGVILYDYMIYMRTLWCTVYLSQNAPPYAQMAAIKRKGRLQTLSISSITSKKCHKVNCQSHANNIYTIAIISSVVFVIILSLCASIGANNTANPHNIFRLYFCTMIV